MNILTKPNGRKVLTVGQFASAASVAPRTVSKWFDAGLLKGYRLPGSYSKGEMKIGDGDRRIFMDSAIEFLEKIGNRDGIEMLKVPTKSMAVLAIGFSEDELKRIGSGIIDDKFVSAVLYTENMFMAGACFENDCPGSILMNLASNRQECKETVRQLREFGHNVRIIGVLGPDNVERTSLFECGFNAIVGPGIDVEAIHDHLVEERAKNRDTWKRRQAQVNASRRKESE